MIRPISILFISLSLSLMAHAVGPSSGGGGDAVILPDDSVVLADPFLNSGAPQPNNMPPMRSLNPRLLQVADSYLKASLFHLELMSPGEGNQESLHSDIAQQIKALSLRRNDLRFYAVRDQTELSLFCAPGGRKSYVLPSGAKVEQVACTAGNETFLVEPLFLRMSLKDQTLLLIHERLTTLRDAQGGKNYSAIARFTTGLGIYLDIYREQYKNRFRTLTEKEQKSLTEFYIAIEEIERRNSEITEDSFQWYAAHTGGGRVHNLSDVAEDAVIGLGFVVGKKSVVKSGAVLKRAYLSGCIPQFVVGERSVIDQVNLWDLKKLQVGDDSTVLKSELSGQIELGDKSFLNSVKVGNKQADFRVEIGDGSSFKEVTFAGSNLKFGDQIIAEASAFQGNLDVRNNTTIENSTLFGSLNIQKNTRLTDSTFAGDFNVGQNARIKNSKINMRQASFLDNSKVENFNITLTYPNSADVRIKDLKDGFLDDQSFGYYPRGFQVKSVSATWKKNFNLETSYEGIGRSTAEFLANYFKNTFYAKDAEFVVQVGTSLGYQQKHIFSDDYVFKFKQSEFRIRFDASQTPTETRTNAYTVLDSEIVPATGGPLKKSYKIEMNQNADQFRFDIVKAKLLELGFKLISDGGSSATYLPPMESETAR